MRRIIAAVLASMVAWSPAEARPPKKHDTPLVLMAVTIYYEARCWSASLDGRQPLTTSIS